MEISRRTFVAGAIAAIPAAKILMAAETQPASAASAAADPYVAVEKTSAGDLTIQCINHSALRFELKGKQYYVDPAGKADWAKMPKADVILITHQHGDHLDPKVIDAIKKDDTVIYSNADVIATKKVEKVNLIEIGEKKKILDIDVEAIAAYNMTADRLKFHPKERKDNGYILTVGETRVYVSGDTEGTPEMKGLKDIAIAFLPINLPYTMPPKEAAEAARAFKPKILYPYHQGKSDPAEVKKLLEDVKEIEVRVLALP